MGNRFYRKLEDAAAVRAAVDAVAEKYAAMGKPLHVFAVALALDMDYDALEDYRDGRNIDNVKEDGSNLADVEEQKRIREEVLRAYALCQCDLGSTLMEHGGNSGAIFMAKCAHRMQDTQRVEVVVPTFSGNDDV